MSEAVTIRQARPWNRLPRVWTVAAVLLSALFTLLQAGPLHGSTAALVITLVLQFYLPGALVLRALRIDRSPHPVVRFVWVLLAAFALNVSLGAALRFVGVPIALYLVILHAIMLALALIRPSLAPIEPIPWRFEAKKLPLYALLAICCAVVVGVAVERDQYRFSGYEDQSVFVELAEWMAHGTDPIDILSRRIGVTYGDTRWDTDGWTYNQAAWVATSGVSAADLIWFRLTPLFVWAVPLTIFTLVFELTKRETTATWAAAALTLLGLMTIDSLVYYPTTITFGQFSLFQVNTLRTIATALVTPLTLIPLLAYLNTSSKRFLLLGFLAGTTVAFMHPRQIVIVLYSVGATGLLQTLARPSRKQLRQIAPAVVVLGLLMLIPLSQQMRREAAFRQAAQARSQTTTEPQLEASPAATPSSASAAPTPSGFHIRIDDRSPRVRLIDLVNLPVIGDTFIVDPTFVFYHPLITLATALGLLIGLLGWRRSFSAQYILGATAVSLALLFVPVVVPIYMRMVTVSLVAGSILGVPLALILGLSLEGLLDRIARRGRAVINGAVAAALVVVMALLLFEPVPIPASARDQIRASNAMQETRNMLPADQALIDSLSAHLDPNRISVIISPNRAANFISESVPRTYITGGRESSNGSYALTQTFMAESDDSSPWLTQRDLDDAQRWKATDVVVQADNWRLAQLALDSAPFTLIGQPTGYAVFRLSSAPFETEIDALDVEMNQLTTATPGRWTGHTLDIQLPGSAESWTPLVTRADALPTSDRADLARAFTRSMAGDDAGALPLWQTLAQTHADTPIFTQIAAETLAALGRPNEGAALLLDRLADANPSVAALAARSLLTERFFYLLTPDQVTRVLDVTRADADAWALLAELDHATDTRERVALLMSAGQTDSAEQWLQRLPTAEIRPEDLLTEASIELARGNINGALAILQPATDADWTLPNRFLHADRWQDNVAAQTYHLLKGEIARRAQQSAQAEDEFNHAIQAGSVWAGRAFLAQTERESGDSASADQTRAALERDWAASNSGPLPEFISLLTLADTHQLYVMSPAAQVSDEAPTVTVTGTFGSGHSAPLSVQTWRIAVLSRDGRQTYAQQDVPALDIPGALVRTSVTLTLPADLAPLTPAAVYIQPRYDNRISFGSVTVPVVLNRPDDAQAPADATAVGARFGDQITLVSSAGSASADGLSLALYWKADAPISDALQVFVHVLDSSNQIVAQADSAPVEGRYPTTQWRADTLIEDTHALKFDRALPSGSYRVVAGLYHLSDLQKLPVSGTTLPTLDGRLQVMAFNVP